MKILITGGAGLIGSHAAEYFAKRGDKVIVLDNLMRSKLFNYDSKSVEYNWNFLKKMGCIKLIKGDCRNQEDLFKALGSGVDAVIHTAGQPGVPSSVRAPLDDFSINALGTLNTLECTRKVSPRAKFVYCSTNKVYGENIDKIPLLEKSKRYIYKRLKGINEGMLTDLTGHTPYGVSKLTGDLYVQEYARIYGMSTCVFRMSCIYGTRQFGFEDQGWVAWFVIANLFNRPVTIYGNGKQVRDLLNAEDLVKAYELFIKGNIKDGLFNIGGGPNNTRSLLEFLSDLKGITGRKTKIKFSQWRPSDQKVYITDITKINKLLGWEPKIGVAEGLIRVVNWVKSNRSFFNKNRC